MTKHFIERLIERCPDVSDPAAVARKVRGAVLAKDETVAVRIMDARVGRSVYRLFLPEGRFYAIVDDVTGAPITFLRQQDMAAIKATVRGRTTSAAAFKAKKLGAELRQESRHIQKRKVRKNEASKHGGH